MKKDLPICSPSGFARAGCGVLVASDGNEALGLFLKLHTSISDVRMPFLSGVDLAEVAELYGCPVLLISGSVFRLASLLAVGSSCSSRFGARICCARRPSGLPEKGEASRRVCARWLPSLGRI